MCMAPMSNKKWPFPHEVGRSYIPQSTSSFFYHLGGALTTCFSDKTASRPGYRIGRSEFAELRPPFWIAARKSGTHKVCVCIYHENAKFMIKGPTLKVSYKELCQVLSKLISEFSLQSSFYYDFSKQLHLTTV